MSVLHSIMNVNEKLIKDLNDEDESTKVLIPNNVEIILEKSSLPTSDVGKKIGAACFFGICSFTITIINKSVLTTHKFPSVQVLGLGQIITSILFLYIGKKCNLIKFPHLQRDTFSQLWPLPIIFIANLIFGLGGTQKISLPMFTTIRKFGILLTMFGEMYILRVGCWVLLLLFIIFNYCINNPLREVPSRNVQISVYIMILGSIVASSDDLAYTFEGYAFVWISNIFTAANGVYMKKKLVSNKYGMFGLMFYNSLFVLLPATLLTWAMGDFQLVQSYAHWKDVDFLLQFSLSCCMGFILTYSNTLCTHITSALTTSIIGCLKNIIITYLGIYIGGDYIFSQVNFIGLNISVIGSIFYAWVTFKK